MIVHQLMLKSRNITIRIIWVSFAHVVQNQNCRQLNLVSVERELYTISTLHHGTQDCSIDYMKAPKSYITNNLACLLLRNQNQSYHQLNPVSVKRKLKMLMHLHHEAYDCVLAFTKALETHNTNNLDCLHSSCRKIGFSQMKPRNS